MPHPNADRLVLCRLDDGEREHIVLTGAPNLYPYKGLGPLPEPLKVPYAREGAQIYDGHQPGQVLTTLKRAKIRGVESYSMICSEKELGISDEHEGVIILDSDAPVGVPLVDYMGDAVLEIAITPNNARNANILGVARETAAILGVPLRQPDYSFKAEGAPLSPKLIEKGKLEPKWSVRTALIVLALATFGVVILSELLVGAVEPVVLSLGISEFFLGIMLIPLIGNVAEHLVAVKVAIQNQMNLSVEIAIASSLQIALFVAPVLVFVSLLLGNPLQLIFNQFELLALIAGVIITALVSADGESNWLEGAELLAVYLILGIAFFLLPV